MLLPLLIRSGSPYSLPERSLLLSLLASFVVAPEPRHQGPVVPQSPMVPVGAAAGGLEEPGACEPITVPVCRGIGYNLTSMPNQFNHDSQSEAGLVVQQFWPLVEINCSPYLRFFLCSMYAPICMHGYYKPLPACREVCETARDDCLPVMRRFGFDWPEQMQCQSFPAFGDKQLCMDIKVAEVADSHISTPRPSPTQVSGSLGDLQLAPGGPHTPSAPASIRGAGSPTKCEQSCQCRPPLVVIDNATSPYYNKVSVGGQLNCALRCDGLHFTDAHERRFARFWLALWASVCALSTLITCLTFLADTQRFLYPERPIVCLSLCYLLVSVGYILPIALGHDDIICEAHGNVKLLRYNTSGPPLCTLTFVLVYFFGMAASSWWVILTLTWYMAAGLKWGQESISRYSPYYHVLAWGIPACQTVAVLALSAVDGDPLAGICFVGNQSPGNARLFLLAPLSAHVLLGVAFLVAGFIALFRIRNSLRRQGLAKTDKLEKLMLRIGVFSVLYTVPACVVILCHFYEHQWRPGWDRAHNCGGAFCPPYNPLNSLPTYTAAAEAHRTAGGASNPHTPLGGEESYYTDRPDFSVFMLKYFLSVVVGITSGFWIWSGKTIETWRGCCDRACCCCCSRGGGATRGGVKLTGVTEGGALRVDLGGPGGVEYSSTKYRQVHRGGGGAASVRTSSYGGRVNVGSNATSVIME